MGTASFAGNGAFVSIDGPGGVGKSNTATSTVDYLQKARISAVGVGQPSSTVLGAHIRGRVDQYRGMALACLVAADRHQQQREEIGPAVDAGRVVVCDRYLPSSLVLQVRDGVSAAKVWQLNEGVRVPDVAVFLRADPALIAARLRSRGAHDRFEADPTHSITGELAAFDAVATELRARGWPVEIIDCGEWTPAEIALAVANLIVPLVSGATTEGRTA